MKKYFIHITITVAIITLAASCHKWLDVQPTDRISDETLFSTPSGFRSALNGIYQQLGTGDLYGRQLTWGMTSAMGQDYTTSKINQEYQKAAAGQMQDPLIAPLLSSTWGTAYTAIANCNKLISEVNAKNDAFFLSGRSERNLIKGEALAIRALLHLDMVRLFAVSPAENNTDPVVPYQDTYPSHLSERLSTPDILKRITADLDSAQMLVAENDTLVNRSALSGGMSTLLQGNGAPIFFSFRMNRLNYVAIHGLMARAYMYAADYDNASKEAFYVYSQFGPVGKRWWSFTAESNTNSVTRYQKLPEDLLLAFYDPNLITNTVNYRTTSNTYPLTDVTTIFPSTERDYRRNNITSDNLSYKWLENTSGGALTKEQNTIMPVLRLSEMYYIYSECLYRKGNSTEALRILNLIRNARGKSTTFTDNSRTGYFAELLMEYRREYIAEGQTFFAHKRLNMPVVIGARQIAIGDNFTPPLPDGEQ